MARHWEDAALGECIVMVPSFVHGSFGWPGASRRRDARVTPPHSVRSSSGRHWHVYSADGPPCPVALK